jgi:hypothetical protein
MSGDPDDGVKVNLSNADTSHFLRLYSGRENLPKPIMYWHHGDALELGMADPDENNYQRFLSFDGRTIGVHNTGYSVFIGEDAGANDNLTDNYNVGIGKNVLQENVDGFSNTAIGAGTMQHNISGFSNVAIGNGAMRDDTLGLGNTAVGQSAMQQNYSGLGNTAIGYLAGYGNGSSYSGNVLIGFRAGENIQSSNRLYIENSYGDYPLIYGEFDNYLLRINGRQEITGDLNIGTAMFVDESAKRVGINTTEPSYSLDVGGPINLNKNIGSEVALRVNNDEALWYDGGYFSWGYGATHNYFRRNMRIGPFESGTSTFAQLHLVDTGFTHLQIESFNHDAVLQLSGSTNSSTIGWTMRRDASDGGKLQWRHDNFSRMTMTTDGKLGVGVSATNPAYTLYVNGDAGKPGGGSWSNSSDRRLKQNVNGYHDGLSEIQKIRPVTFQYNELSGYDTEPEYVGVIAQDLREVAPYMVSENETGYLDVNNSAMTYMLVNAVQEQQEMIKALQEEVAALKALVGSSTTASAVKKEE